MNASYTFIFKLNLVSYAALVALRSWKNPVTELAKRTGFGKSYISQAVRGNIELSQAFMASYIKATGADPKTPQEWASLFVLEQVNTETEGRPYQADNYAKYKGEKPYTAPYEGGISEAERFRSADKARNLSRLDQPDPLPASEFYEGIASRKNFFQKGGQEGRRRL